MYKGDFLREVKKQFSSLLVFVMFFCSAPKVYSAELLMIESASCEWCELWHEEVGVIYSKTPEGQFAPLKRIDIADFSSSLKAKIRFPNFTPTFVILNNGEEIARIIGYAGEDFFWDLLHDALKKAGFQIKD